MTLVKNYKKIGKDKIQCIACNHYCAIKEGRVGTCGVRQNLGGELKLLVYGKAAAVNVDPIEKKPLYHFLPGSKSFSFGTVGCNFRCDNCQNFDISQISGFKGQLEKYKNMRLGYDFPPEEIVKKAVENHCRSIAYTYNEPTIFLEYALDTMKLAREKDLKNVWVSNGFMSPEVLEQILPWLDAVNVDLKSFEDEFYRKHCGAGLDPVLENLKKIAESKTWLEVTTLLIPGLSDDRENLQKIAGFIKNELGEEVPWHISAFSGAISWKLRDYPETSAEKMKEAYQIGFEAGLKYVYAGNISLPRTLRGSL
ncbi:MAG: AmmeMemoRadiSam system radical SAM enzyme [Candidatus Moranbacteria bacterium]|nr:AmmeMemoRadiSam system radical SAM enzyme [Candidatus Moranbacteria bacterium]